MAENNTEIHEQPQISEQRQELYAQINGVSSQLDSIRAKARQSRSQEDKDALTAMEEKYNAIPAAQRVEAKITHFLESGKWEKERGEGAKPSDPGGEKLYFTKKKDKKGKAIRNGEGHEVWELIFNPKDFEGWTSDALDAQGNTVTKGTITQLQEHITNLTGLTKNTLSRVSGLETAERDYIEESLEVNRFTDDQARVVIQFLMTQGLSFEEAQSKLNPEALARSLASRLGRNQDIRGGYLDFFNSLGIDQEYVMRFVLPKMFEPENNDRRMGVTNGVEDLAWKISVTNPALFSLNGKYPVLEHRIIRDKTTNKIDWEKSRNLYLNKGNLNRWILERIDELWDSKPHDFVDYFSEVRLKTGPISMYDIPLAEIFHAKDTFLKSQYDWLDTTDELVRDLQLDAWVMLYGRTAYLTDDQKIQGNENAIVEGAKAIHNNNSAVRKTFGSNMFFFAATSPLNERGVATPGELPLRDGIKGAAWNEILLTYQHLSDFDKLQEILGSNSNFFTQEGAYKAMEKFAGKIAGHTGRRDVRGFLGNDLYNAFEKAFDENGKVVNGTVKMGRGRGVADILVDENGKERLLTEAERERIKHFTKLVNIFNTHAQDSNQVKFVREGMVLNAIEEKYGFLTERGEKDGYSLRFAERLAYDWTAPSLTGIWSLNDEKAQAFKGWTKWMRTGLYRLKMAKDSSGMRAGSLGNPRTIRMFPQLYVPFTWALNSKTPVDIVDSEGKVVGARQKSANEVLHELQQLRMKNMRQLNHRREQLESEGKSQGEIDAALEKEERWSQELYIRKAGELDFNENAQRVHQTDHIDRIAKLWDIVIGAKEIDFEKFTSYDIYMPGMPRFDRVAFQKEIQDEFLKPLRYAYQTYGDINFNMIVRAPKIVPDKELFTWKTEWTDMPLGEALFGQELVDRPEFLQRNKAGMPLRDKDGHHIIDWNKVQKNKLLVWKQWAIMKIAADIQQHRARYTMDKKHPPSYYEHIFEALESIPGAIWANEFHMSETQTPENFFSHLDMTILKKKGLAAPILGMTTLPFTKINIAEKLTKTRFYFNWLWRDLKAKEDEERWGTAIMFGMIFGQVFKDK